MAQTDHIVSQNLGLINGLLHSLVQLLAVVTAQNIIDIAALALIHEVSRSRLGEGLGRGDAHKCDHAAADGEVFDIGRTRLPSGRLTQLLERYGKSASAITSFARAMP